MNGYDWSYVNSAVIDPPLEVMVDGTTSTIAAWIASNRASLVSGFNSVPVPPTTGINDGGWQSQAGAGSTASYQSLHVVTQYAAGTILNGKWVGGYFAKPSVIDPAKPLVICLHGHELSGAGFTWGQPPFPLWNDHWWPEQIVQAGYVCFSPSHLPYTQLSSLYPAWPYHVVWTRFVWDIIQRAMSAPSGVPAFNGMVVAGLSSGGMGGAFLMGWRPEISRGVFAGSLQPLDFLRQNYRYSGNPNQWDMPNVYSYLPYYLLCADRRVQWQLGKADSFYPGNTPFPPSGTAFAGTDRDVMVSEILGDFLPAKNAAAMLGGAMQLLSHTGGHEFKVAEAVTFFGAA